MRKITPLIVITLCGMAFWPRPVSALNMSMSPKPKFDYKDASGKRRSVEIIDKYQPKKIVHPFAKLDPKIDPKLCPQLINAIVAVSDYNEVSCRQIEFR